MSKTIYLYGKGATASGKSYDGCYLKCAIPDDQEQYRSGFLPSVLHSYIMYAKDIGLLVSDVIYEGFEKPEEEWNQLSYSLWPLFYVNNSNAFTADNAQGIGIWKKNEESPLTLETSILLNPTLSFYYRNDDQPRDQLALKNIQSASSNPEPIPNNPVQADSSWYLDLTLPDDKDSESKASTYSIVRHYNEAVVWNTLIDMSSSINKHKRYNGLKGATGKTLQNVVDTPYAYNSLMPSWPTNWGQEPEWYDKMRLSMNNYNISASLFVYDVDKDPDSPNTHLRLFATAGNIKGSIKSGHAETRLLLTLDTLNHSREKENWIESVCKYYSFNDPTINFKKIINFYEKKYIALISSLKPCYLCVGETDATANGFIKSIEKKKVMMWATYPEIGISTNLKKVVYFDVDRPIVYPATLEVVVHIQGKEEDYEWTISLSSWNEWTAALSEAVSDQYTQPIGPRIVEPAGECLKTGYSYIRYKNSAYLLLTESKKYVEEFLNLTRNAAIENEDEIL